MRHQEIEEYYNRIIETLRNTNLSWIVDQVDDTIKQGSEKEISIHPLEEGRDTRTGRQPKETIIQAIGLQPPEAYERKKGRKVSLYKRSPFSEAEKLQCLINAIQHATLHSLEMEERANQSLTNISAYDGNNIEKIQFVEDEASSTPQQWGLIQKDRAAVKKLNDELSSLSREVGE